jgi:alpha-tubulin suppressor-like RCC1 family protein
VSMDGQLYGWGFGFYHQLGQKEDNEDHLDPIKITLVENEVKIGEDGREEKVIVK